MLFSLVLLALASTTFAITCPPVTAWSHVKGHPWVLNAEGWTAETTQMSEAINSDKVGLDKFTDVYVTVAGREGSFCKYWTGDYFDNGRVTITAINPTFVNPRIVDHEIFTLAKDEGGGYLESTCKASNPRFLNLCAW